MTEMLTNTHLRGVWVRGKSLLPSRYRTEEGAISHASNNETLIPEGEGMTETRRTDDRNNPETTDPLVKHKTEYGNIDVRHRAPDGLVHFSGQRLTVTARAAGIEHAKAFAGFQDTRWGWKPILDGIVVREEDAAAMESAIKRRDARRPSPEQRERRRKRRAQKKREEARRGRWRKTRWLARLIRAEYPGMPRREAVKCAYHATEPGSGRIGDFDERDDPHDHIEHLAVEAHVRHRHTRYDARLSEEREIYGVWGTRDDRREMRSEARKHVRPEVDRILDAWQEGNSASRR
jgi:hypothetical protein